MNRPPDGPAPRIFIDGEISPGTLALLDEAASRHIAGALRLRAGAPVTLFDGRGGEYPAQVERVDRKSVAVRILGFEQADKETPLPVALGLAVSRGDRMDYAVQKSTELGVSEIYPLVTERTEVRVQGERREKKRLHWQQIAVSACEQCGRNRIPVVHGIQPLGAWLENLARADGAGTDCRLVLHPHSAAGLNELPQPRSVSLLVGPEGGLSEAEIDAARAASFHPMCLGPRILRTETAPVAALAIVQFKWGDMR